jgi:hypothetical protein
MFDWADDSQSQISTELLHTVDSLAPIPPENLLFTSLGATHQSTMKINDTLSNPGNVETWDDRWRSQMIAAASPTDLESWNLAAQDDRTPHPSIAANGKSKCD